MMLKYTFNLASEAEAIEKAVSDVLDQGLRTADLYNKEVSGLTQVSTVEMGDAVVAALNK